MRTHVISPDLHGRIDGTVAANLLSGFPDQSSSRHDCDVIIVPVSLLSDFQFNTALREIDRPYIICDFLEYEWKFDMASTHLIGRNTRECRWLTPAWFEFCDWAKDNPPVIYFKRELYASDVSEKVKPLDWPAYLAPAPLQSEEEFNKRPVEVLFNWGYSHPSRPRLHADIFRAMTTHGIGVISEFNQFQDYFRNPCARTWAPIFTPWYARTHINNVLWLQQRSKISVSLNGAGKKCFRHSEAPVDSIMALQHDALAWSYSWVNGINCIRLRVGHEFEDVEKATKWPKLYEIYVSSQETIEKYRTKPYVQNYMIPLIQARV